MRRRQVLEIGVFRMLGLVAVLAFSAPSLWEWANALPLLLKGADVVNTGNARYVLTALCMPFPAVSCIIGLVGRFRLQTASGRVAKAGVRSRRADRAHFSAGASRSSRCVWQPQLGGCSANGGFFAFIVD
ncbi:integral membrane protein [Neisseria gonorrhoeae]|uniref:Integral membrane protein n=1 Tax=Neisseria gonorrhoeae TaxID=485 RepID=A0A379B095_NEIGO|nr:integral membrane protein [Neisseria gonorrhoeae]